MTIKQESEPCLISYFAFCGICIEEIGTGKWVDILGHIWQTMDNYWGGIVERTKISSQILKGDCEIKFRVPFIKKFIHHENHWMWVVGDYWGDWGFLGTLWCIWWREEEGGVPLLGRSPEDAGVDHWVSHQPRATPSFKAKVVSMFVDCRFLEEKSKIGYIQGFR